MSSPSTDLCVRCGYDLRGVADDGPCPECGLLAERSRTSSDALVDASPRWLASVLVGTALVFAAQAIIIGATVAMGDRRYYLLGLTGDPALDRVTLNTYELAAAALGVGVWLLTRGQRDDALDRGARAGRWLGRLAAWLPLATIVGVHVVSRTRLLSLFEPWLTWTVLVALTAAGAATGAFVFGHLRRLALRDGHPRLAAHARALVWAFPLAMLGVVAATWLLSGPIPFTGSMDWPTRHVLGVAITVAATGLALFVACWGDLVCAWFAVRCARTRGAARRKWRLADRAG